MRKQLAALVIAGTALAGVVVAPGAEAQTTTTTFTLTAAGGLEVSVPTAKQLSAGTATNAGTLAAQLGTVTVTDSRGALLGTWNAAASSTAFTTGLATANETIAATNVAYNSGLPTIVSGTIVPVSTGAQTIDTAKNVVTATGSVGNNSVSWNPTVTVTIPSTAVVGDYTGTITHSFA